MSGGPRRRPARGAISAPLFALALLSMSFSRAAQGSPAPAAKGPTPALVSSPHPPAPVPAAGSPTSGSPSLASPTAGPATTGQLNTGLTPPVQHPHASVLPPNTCPGEYADNL